MTETPLYIKVHGDDNVAIVVNPLGLPPGTEFPCGLVLRDFVTQGHKVALADVAEGAPIIRYGEMIGTAARAIPKGSRIKESAVRLPTAPPLDSLPFATNIRHRRRRADLFDGSQQTGDLMVFEQPLDHRVDGEKPGASAALHDHTGLVP